MPELNVDPNIKNDPKSTSVLAENEMPIKTKSTIITERLKTGPHNSNSIPKSSVNINHPKASHSSPSAPLTITKSETDSKGSKGSKGSVESDRNSTKSDPTEWRINRYIPKGFRRRANKERKGQSFFRLIRLDCKVLNSCTAYSQIIILGTSFMIIFIILMTGCFSSDVKKAVKAFQQRNANANNTIERNRTTETTTENCEPRNANNTIETDSTTEVTIERKWTTETTIEKPEPSAVECNSQYYFIMICVIALTVEMFTITFYLFHFVEALPNIPWLAIESIFYFLWAVQYFVMSIWMSFYGSWFKVTTFLGIIDSILLLILAIIKYSKYMTGTPAQDRTDDPDGNSLRKLSPNLKFTKSVEELGVHKKSLVKKSDSLGSL